MTYATINEIAESPSLLNRVRACVAEQAAANNVSIANPMGWVMDRMLTIAASPEWDDQWEYARNTYTPQFNPDTGARPDVISDANILAAVQPLVLALKPTEPTTTAEETATEGGLLG